MARHIERGGWHSMRKALLLAAVMLAPLYSQPRDVIKVDFAIRDSGDAGGKSGRKYSLLLNRALDKAAATLSYFACACGCKWISGC